MPLPETPAGDGRDAPPVDTERTIQALQLRVAELELKLEDTVDLLHMWKSEASAYLSLAQAVVQGVFTIDKAKAMLERRAPQTRCR